MHIDFGSSKSLFTTFYKNLNMGLTINLKISIALLAFGNKIHLLHLIYITARAKYYKKETDI